MKNLALLAVMAALGLGATVANAKELPNHKAAVKALSDVPAAELPAVAVQLVTASPTEEKAKLVSAVIRKVAQTNPSALRHVVAAIAKADPKLAVVAAGSAAKANPESVGAIAAAACNSAPEKAAAILAICSRVTVVGTGTLAEMIAGSNPTLSAANLVNDAATVDVTADASIIGGGTILRYDQLPLPPGAIGQNMKGDYIFLTPPSAGPGSAGVDPDRYAAAGS